MVHSFFFLSRNLTLFSITVQFSPTFHNIIALKTQKEVRSIFSFVLLANCIFKYSPKISVRAITMLYYARTLQNLATTTRFSSRSHFCGPRYDETIHFLLALLEPRYNGTLHFPARTTSDLAITKRLASRSLFLDLAIVTQFVCRRLSRNFFAFLIQNIRTNIEKMHVYTIFIIIIVLSLFVFRL